MGELPGPPGPGLVLKSPAKGDLPVRSAPVAAIALLAALTLAGCSSSASVKAKPSVPVTTSGTETLTAVDTGAAAAANLNSNSNAPLTFPEATWTGPVSVTVKPFTLPGSGGSGGNAAATVTLDTPSGNATVHHSANQAPGANDPNQPPPATWSKAGTTCRFVTTFSKGTVTFLSGTGRFKGAASPAAGTYLVTAQGYAPLKPGEARCGFDTTGPVQDSGAQVKFVAAFPVTVKG
jgi:hypothetical protein